MFDDLIGSYYLGSALRAAQQLPKEFVYAAVAGLTINEVHKRHSNVKLEEVKATAKAREIELEIEKLRLQIQLREVQS